MTTLILSLTPVMATRVAKVADALSMATHEDVGLTAVGLFCESILGPMRGRKAQSKQANSHTRAQRKGRGPRVP